MKRALVAVALLVTAGTAAAASDRAPWHRIPRKFDLDADQCQIWDPSLAPSQQDAPVACADLAQRDPGDARFLIVGDRIYDLDYDWQAYADGHPGDVPAVVVDLASPGAVAAATAVGGEEKVTARGSGATRPAAIERPVGNAQRPGAHRDRDRDDWPRSVEDGPRPLRIAHVDMPERGRCRLWYPDRARQDQPRSLACRAIRMPAAESGAFLLYGGRAWDADYDWAAYDRAHPGAVPPVVLDLTTHPGTQARERVRERDRERGGDRDADDRARDRDADDRDRAVEDRE